MTSTVSSQEPWLWLEADLIHLESWAPWSWSLVGEFVRTSFLTFHPWGGRWYQPPLPMTSLWLVVVPTFSVIPKQIAGRWSLSSTDHVGVPCSRYQARNFILHGKCENISFSKIFQFLVTRRPGRQSLASCMWWGDHLAHCQATRPAQRSMTRPRTSGRSVSASPAPGPRIVQSVMVTVISWSPEATGRWSWSRGWTSPQASGPAWPTSNQSGHNTAVLWSRWAGGGAWSWWAGTAEERGWVTSASWRWTPVVLDRNPGGKYLISMLPDGADPVLVWWGVVSQVRTSWFLTPSFYISFYIVVIGGWDGQKTLNSIETYDEENER